jgi:hypothetical protein
MPAHKSTAATCDDDRARLRVASAGSRSAIEVVDRRVVGGIELLGPCELEATDAVAAGRRVAGVQGSSDTWFLPQGHRPRRRD